MSLTFLKQKTVTYTVVATLRFMGEYDRKPFSAPLRVLELLLYVCTYPDEKNKLLCDLVSVCDPDWCAHLELV